MAKIERSTKETDINLELKLNGTGKYNIKTGLRFLDHMLDQLAKHSGFDVNVEARSLDGNEHHLVEDVGIVLGQALEKELGDKKGIERFGYAIISFDDSVAEVALDLSGRPYWNIDLPFSEFEERKVDDVSKENIEHFLESFAINGKFNLYAKVSGRNDHHKVEAVFKALARALRMACARTGKGMPSTKGLL